MARRGADARRVVRAVEAKLAELAGSFPEGLTVSVFHNRAERIETAVGSVSEALLIAVGLVILLLVLFLGDWRAALVVRLILPAAMLATFILMRVFGLTANLMSLGGLAIAIGMIVDGDIVVADNTVERLRMNQKANPLHVISRVGSDELGLDPMGLNESDMFLQLAPRESWRGPDTEWLVGEIRSVVGDFVGIETAFTQPIEMRVSELLTGSRGHLAIKIFGTEYDALADLAGQIETIVSGIPGASDVFTTSNDVSEYLQIDIHPQRAGRYGFTVVDIQEELRARFEGVTVGEIIEPGRRTPILIRYDRELSSSVPDVSQINLVTPRGIRVPLNEIATIERVSGLAAAARENASRYAVVQAFVEGRDLVSFVNDAQIAVSEQIELPTGYTLEFGGEFEDQRRASARLSLMVPLSIGLIFIVLFVTLRSLRQSLLILFNIPFALVGGIIALNLSGEYLSVPASVGLIALLGVAVLNGLVLVTCFNDLDILGHPIEKTVCSVRSVACGRCSTDSPAPTVQPPRNTPEMSNGHNPTQADAGGTRFDRSGADRLPRCHRTGIGRLHPSERGRARRWCLSRNGSPVTSHARLELISGCRRASIKRRGLPHEYPIDRCGA